MAKTKRREPSISTDDRVGSESDHSHFEYPSVPGNWEAASATDFAITTVNVPDRLDAQELRARRDAEDAAPRVSRFHPSDLTRWAGRAFLIAIFGGLVWGGFQLAVPVREAFSANGLSERLTITLKAPTTVRASRMEWWPAPRLVVSGIDVVGRFAIPEASVHFNWSDAVEALRNAKVVLGEARVAPLRLGGPAAQALLETIPAAGQLPAGVSTLRFDSIEVDGVPLLPGRYTAVVRRGANGTFNSIALTQVDTPAEALIEIATATAEQQAAFKVFARNWKAPVGPDVTWSEATAQGRFGPDRLQIDTYSVGAAFGNLNGAGALERSAKGWTVTGSVKGANLRVDDLIRFLRGVPTTEGDRFRPVLSGAARLDLAVSGSGATAQDALRDSIASGPVAVRGATLDGLNLGLAATLGNLREAGGLTQLADLEARLTARPGGFLIRDISGRAGGLRVGGGFDVTPGLRMTGGITSTVVSPRGNAVMPIRLGGTVTSPEFAR